MTSTAPRAESAASHVYTMHDLAEETMQVMRAIVDSGEPALITLRGRVVAQLTPLVGREVEGDLISVALEGSVTDPAELLNQTEGLTTAEMLKTFGQESGG
ncbi:hypothetical protein [Streptomyces chartreusis]|uniref:hypothetical protein n=1 Tax=Streptomyces chartreusis TaxID=1969 RepID=UPI0037FC0BA2